MGTLVPMLITCGVWRHHLKKSLMGNGLVIDALVSLYLVWFKKYSLGAGKEWMRIKRRRKRRKREKRNGEGEEFPKTLSENSLSNGRTHLIHCSWVQEIQLDVYWPQGYKMYLRKNDMDEPLRYDEEGENEDKEGGALNKRLKHHKVEDPLKLYERFYRYGIRPTWLQPNRVINKRIMKDGSVQYLVKWTDMTYADSSW